MRIKTTHVECRIKSKGDDIQSHVEAYKQTYLDLSAIVRFLEGGFIESLKRLQRPRLVASDGESINGERPGEARYEHYRIRYNPNTEELEFTEVEDPKDDIE